MPRPPCPRRIGFRPGATYFKPAGVPLRVLEEVVVTLDEMEALRLADWQGRYQEQAAEGMGISRTTFARIVESARRKVAGALLEGKALRLEGGPVVGPTTTERSETMPRKDSTGPCGQGPGTGWGMGPCGGGRPGGMGPGGRGMGRRGGRRMGAGPTPDPERQALQAQAASLEKALDDIRQRLSATGAKSTAP